MPKIITQCKIINTGGLMDLDEQLNQWLEEMNEKRGFEITHSDHEISGQGSSGRPNIVLIIFYKVEK